MEKQKSLLNLSQEYDEDFKLCDLPNTNLKKYTTKNSKNTKFKEDYFAFYDDIKSPSLKKQDW